MSEVTSTQAAEIIGTTQQTIYRHVDAGLLEARRQGLRRVLHIEIDELRRYATEYGYRFNEDLAAAYTEPGK